MRKTAVILAAVLLAGSLSACAGGAEATHEQAEAAEVLVVDPNAGPGHAGEEKTAAHHALSGEMEAPFVPRAAAEPVSPAVITEIPQPVHHAETPVAAPTAPTAAPTNTPTPTVTPTLTPTPSHQHKWVTETIVDKEAYDEEVLKKEAWVEQIPVPDEEIVVEEAWDEYAVSYVCNLCGASAASPEEMEAHHQAAHAEAADFAFTEQQVLVAHHDAVTETVSHAGEFTEVPHEAEYETVHHEAVTHTIEWCSVCGVLKEQADRNTNG